ncbi:alcohol dehydrogenase [Bradyrhizobium sp. LHD-71]|uniref:alcohol dehydrogenase n=1 Tax=Bradyrhizobium sp. LHD-71 TaxID=3072141 RepID=UPI00280E0434|nr:alcohol dehydrogenase [Bradyrhizobium sp. LHD-71]MDQ8731961.1 alcohol dehydrogenase [Bradyrhizobium sp. LHD-71]
MRCYQLTAFGQPLAKHDQPAPEPVGTEVIVKVRGAGVCHSDVHIWEGHYDLGGGKKLSFAERIKFPLTPGHETAGEVFRIGPDAKDVKLGAKVLACSWIGCGDCEQCLAGDEHLCAKPRFLGVNCNGGYADLVTVPHPRYLVDIGDLDPVAAAPLVCSGLTTYSALKKFGAALQQSPVVIFGAGGLGLMSLGVLQMMKGHGAVVVEIDQRKREEALKAGAIAAIDPRAPNAAQMIRDATGRPVRLILDLVGSGETASLGIDLLEKGGKLIIVGLIGGETMLSVPMVPMKSITIQGSYVGSPTELRELVEMVKVSGLPAMPLDRRPLAAASSALDDLRQGKVVGRVVLVP